MVGTLALVGGGEEEAWGIGVWVCAREDRNGLDEGPGAVSSKASGTGGGGGCSFF